MFDYLIDKMDGEEYDTYEEFENAVHYTIDDAIEGLGRAERWACQKDKAVLDQLGVTIKEMQNEDVE